VVIGIQPKVAKVRWDDTGKEEFKGVVFLARRAAGDEEAGRVSADGVAESPEGGEGGGAEVQTRGGLTADEDVTALHERGAP
jgi:hypothetical protein